MDQGHTHWTQWLDAHGPALVLFACQWTSCRADAEDVVQEAFLRFWRSRQQANDPVAYLYTCVKHCALQWHRGQTRRVKREEAVAQTVATDQALFTCPLEMKERQQAVEVALRSLAAEQREVVVLRIWGELSFPHIAEALGISVNTASSRYRYALAHLREQLAEEVIL